MQSVVAMFCALSFSASVYTIGFCHGEQRGFRKAYLRKASSSRDSFSEYAAILRVDPECSPAALSDELEAFRLEGFTPSIFGLDRIDGANSEYRLVRYASPKKPADGDALNVGVNRTDIPDAKIDAAESLNTVGDLQSHEILAPGYMQAVARNGESADSYQVARSLRPGLSEHQANQIHNSLPSLEGSSVAR